MNRTKKPLVSVIIPVYNQEKYLAQTIESVLSQTYTNFELLLVNDGSTDKSSEIIEQHAASDNRIVTIHIQNGGKPNAVNTGADRSKGEILAFLDHDDLMLPNRLETQVQYLENHPEVNAVSSNCNYVNEDGTKMGIQRYDQLQSPEESKAALQAKEPIMCAFTALTIEKTAFEKIGGLRSRYWPSDDIDFINRIPQNNFLLVILNESLVNYRIHSQSTTSSNQWYLFRMADYTNHCVQQRYRDEEELTFDEFLAWRKKDTWILRMRRNSHNHSIVLLQQANFYLQSKEYFKFIVHTGLSFVLDPKYVIANMRKRGKLMNTSN